MLFMERLRGMKLAKELNKTTPYKKTPRQKLTKQWLKKTILPAVYFLHIIKIWISKVNHQILERLKKGKNHPVSINKAVLNVFAATNFSSTENPPPLKSFLRPVLAIYLPTVKSEKAAKLPINQVICSSISHVAPQILQVTTECTKIRYMKV